MEKSEMVRFIEIWFIFGLIITGIGVINSIPWGRLPVAYGVLKNEHVLFNCVLSKESFDDIQKRNPNYLRQVNNTVDWTGEKLVVKKCEVT